LPLVAAQVTADIDGFVGTWVYDSGTRKTTCTDGRSSEMDLTGKPLTLETPEFDLNGDIRWVVDSCSFSYDVVLRTAWVQGDQDCSLLSATYLTNGQVSITEEGSFILSADGKNLTQEKTVLNIEHPHDHDWSARCTDTLRGVLRR
jgi:hypothetical protein